MDNKEKSFLVILLTYTFAFFFAFLIGIFLKSLHPLFIVLISDIVGTFIVYFLSMKYENASIYDPYWSVAPIFIAFYFFIICPLSGCFIRKVVVITLTSIWGFRLTWNWAINWKGLDHEDWRYRMYRDNNPNLFWLINLFGIQLMPTILVYLGSLSLFPALANNETLFNLIDFIAILITSGAIIIESLSDYQLRKFIERRETYQKIMKKGLWKYSRHPNYFGEILFWWGLYFFALASNMNFWWTIIGPIAVTALFNFISIPLMDKRNLERRPDYREHMKKTSKLIPWKINN